MPKSRKEFEHNMHLLSKRAENGQLHHSISSRRSIKGLMNARYAPNRRVNLHTVDEMARLMANTVANIMQMKEFKTNENGKE